METVTVSRQVDAPADTVEAAIRDVGPFMEACGFDEVTVDGDLVHIRNVVGLFVPVTLDVAVFEDPDATLAYRQHEGMFREMETRFTVEEAGDGVEVTATTDFEIDVAAVGMVLDATVVKRQRRSELVRQLDYLESLPDGTE